MTCAQHQPADINLLRTKSAQHERLLSAIFMFERQLFCWYSGLRELLITCTLRLPTEKH